MSREGSRAGSRHVRRESRRRRSDSRRTAHANVREAAAWVLERTLDSLAPVDTFLAGAQSRCDARDHGLLSELVFGTLRWLRLLDHVVAAAADRPFTEIETALHAPLRLGAYQLLFLNRVPHHAVVHEAVEQAGHVTHRGGARFVNAVLRRIARSPRLDAWKVQESDPAVRLGIELSHPDFLVRRWLERFGEVGARELMAANNRERPLHVLGFRDRGGRELLAEELIDEGLAVEPSTLAPFGLRVLSGRPWQTESFTRGDLYIQDEASQVAALLPPPRPGDLVLDVASAPGGKSFSILSSEPTTQCVASDVSLARALLVRRNRARLGRDLPIVVSDGARPAFAQIFDRVMVDLPCSGTGTLRRKPEIKWRLSEAEIGRLAANALTLLQGASRHVRAGGLLTAITCSIEPDENEHVVCKFLQEASDFEVFDLGVEMPRGLRDGLESTGLWRVLPVDHHDGFTVQALVRTG